MEVGKNLGAKYLPPDSPNDYKGKKDAQDAHEAIRPDRCCAQNAGVGRACHVNDEQLKLYTLIWRRFVASGS